jgi:WD40 repeat protein
MKGHSNYIFAIVMPNPGMIVSCSYDETVRVWDFEKGKSITIFKEFKTSFNDLCVWSPHEVITCSDDKAIRLFNISSG